jgi:hypothetical protein
MVNFQQLFSYIANYSKANLCQGVRKKLGVTQAPHISLDSSSARNRSKSVSGSCNFARPWFYYIVLISPLLPLILSLIKFRILFDATIKHKCGNVVGFWFVRSTAKGSLEEIQSTVNEAELFRRKVTKNNRNYVTVNIEGDDRYSEFVIFRKRPLIRLLSHHLSNDILEKIQRTS